MTRPWGTPILVLFGALFLFSTAHAKVQVSVEGMSNGTLLYDFKGPKGLNERVTVNKSGGSIRTASARALFERYRVLIGNKVVSAGTTGDADLTHVPAGSLFFGMATFRAAKPGATVKNFKIQYHVDGALTCNVTDPNVPENYSLARVESEVRFNGVERFSGTATVDGVTGFDGGKGKFAGAFVGTKKSVKIDKNFILKLGTLRDGKKYPMFFYGATLVSYADKIPVQRCAAEFDKTSSFAVSKEEAQRGRFTFQPAKIITATATPRPWPIYTYPDLTVTLEDANGALLDRIDRTTIRLFERLGDGGSLTPKSISDVDDADSDGVPDRSFVFDGFSLFQRLALTGFGPAREQRFLLVAETASAEPVLGVAAFTVEK